MTFKQKLLDLQNQKFKNIDTYIWVTKPFPIK